MKKHFFFAALAAVTGLMTSCSTDDELSSTAPQSTNAITFSTNQKNTPLSRSGETLTSLTKFTVTAVNDDKSLYFDAETFNYSAGIFKSSISHYWPTTGTLSFYAISDPGTKSLDSNNIPSYTYTNWAAQKDLVAATSLAGSKQIPFPLTFQHVTSQVLIGAEAENKTEELTYKLTAVTMTTPSTGTYYFDTVSGCPGTWQIDNTKTSTYSFSDALPMSFAHNATNKLDNCYWNILPVTDGQITFRVEYQVLQNGKIISDFTGSNYKEVIVDKPNLMSGKIYTYNFILTRSTNDAITFTTSIRDWQDNGSEDYTPVALSEKVKAILTNIGYWPMNFDSLLDDCEMPCTSKADGMYYEIVTILDKNGPIDALDKAWDDYLTAVDWFNSGETAPLSPSDYLRIYNGVKNAIDDIKYFAKKKYTGPLTAAEVEEVFNKVLANAPDKK